MTFGPVDPWGASPASLGSGIAGQVVGDSGMTGADGLLAGASMMMGGDPSWGSLAAQAAGAMLGGRGTSSPSSAYQQSDVAVDHSGWNVNFGAGSVESDRSQSTAMSFLQLAALVLGILVSWKALK